MEENNDNICIAEEGYIYCRRSSFADPFEFTNYTYGGGPCTPEEGTQVDLGPFVDQVEFYNYENTPTNFISARHMVMDGKLNHVQYIDASAREMFLTSEEFQTIENNPKLSAITNHKTWNRKFIL